MITINLAPRINVPIAHRIRAGRVPYLAQRIPLSALLHQTQHIGGELSETDGAAGFNHASPSIAGAKRNHG